MKYGLLLALIVGWVRGAGERTKWQAVCSLYGYTLIEGYFGNETHWLCLKMLPLGSSRLISESSFLYLDPDPNEDTVYQSFHDITMAQGFPVEDPAAGSAEGYIGDDKHFHGVLHLGNRILHADPHHVDDPQKHFGAFEDDNMEVPESERLRREFAQTTSIPSEQFSYRIEHKTRTGFAHARICDLLLLADKEFFEKDANSSLTQAVRMMLHTVAQADVIFRNADFNEDGVPDNIGFTVKYILVLTSNETNMRVFGDLLNYGSVDGRSYLMRFARLRRLSEVCLGVAFSGHAFQNRTLGLSFTSLGGGMGGAAGGVCDRRAYGRSYNTLALSHATADDDTVRVPERISALTLAHEMGHSFGAHHDDNFPNKECKGYLMSSQSTQANHAHHFEFSVCSRRLIATTLHSMSYCLSEEDKPYCGNGIVEEGESCDCGLPSKCSNKDPCCTPRAGGALVMEEGALHKEGCSVAPTAMCHPSQGLCCTSKCTFANLTEHGIECKQIYEECLCVPPSPECRCGLGGRCGRDGGCQAVECATLGLNECPCSQRAWNDPTTKSGICSICCLLSDDQRCVNAATAAMEMLANTSRLPPGWPDQDYVGPNMTVEICAGNKMCRRVVMRAWAAGTPCVAGNVVGTCSERGTCSPAARTPRSNVYPTILKQNFGVHSLSSKSKRKSVTPIFYIWIFILLYK